MTLQSQIENDYKQAFKSNDRPAVSAFRMLKSAIKNREIEIGRELTDPETVEIVSREVKKRREAAVQYERGGRAELAAKETADVDLFAKYLPPPITEAELNSIVQQAVVATGAAGLKDLGQVMAAVMAKVKGRAEGAAVQAAVKKALGG